MFLLRKLSLILVVAIAFGAQQSAAQGWASITPNGSSGYNTWDKNGSSGINLPNRTSAIVQVATKSGSASQFISELGEQANQVLLAPSLTQEQRKEHFREILRQGFNVDFIGRFVIGNHWRKASAQQKADYQRLFGEYILQIYAGRFGGYAGEKLAITEEKPAGKTDVVVRTRISRPSGSPINADWRVRVTDGRYGIIDVMVQGVSMALTHRQEFSGLIKKRGVDGLINLLHDRVYNLSAKLVEGKG